MFENLIDRLESSFKILKGEVKTINDKLDKAHHEQDQIVKQISTMFEQENQIRDELMPLKEKYRDFIVKYDENMSSLGECVCLFKDAVSSMDSNLTTIDRYLGSGEYKEAYKD